MCSAMENCECAWILVLVTPRSLEEIRDLLPNFGKGIIIMCSSADLTTEIKGFWRDAGTSVVMSGSALLIDDCRAKEFRDLKLRTAGKAIQLDFLQNACGMDISLLMGAYRLLTTDHFSTLMNLIAKNRKRWAFNISCGAATNILDGSIGFYQRSYTH